MKDTVGEEINGQPNPGFEQVPVVLRGAFCIEFFKLFFLL